MNYTKIAKLTGFAGLALSAGLAFNLNTSEAATTKALNTEKLSQVLTDFCEHDTYENVAYTSITIAPNLHQTVTENEVSANYENIGISIAKDYVCIRAKASTDSDIKGKLKRGSSATILSTKGQWVKVQSGSIKGYIKKQYLAIGKDAEKIAGKYMIKKATAKTDGLNLRKKNNTSSDIQDVLNKGDSYKVLKETEHWVKVKVADKTGYLNKEYVVIKDTFEVAVSYQADSKAQAASGNSSSAQSTGKRIASYALNFIGNPYVWGGTSLTRGTDCSGFTQSVYSHFGIYIPRDSRSQSGAGKRVSLSSLQPGDLIFYARGGRINHVALYIGGGQVVSAANEKLGIRISSYNYRTPVCARRFV